MGIVSKCMFYPSDYRGKYNKNIKRNNLYCVHTKINILNNKGYKMYIIEGKSTSWDIIPRTINLSSQYIQEGGDSDINVYIKSYDSDCDGSIMCIACSSKYNDLKDKYGGDEGI